MKRFFLTLAIFATATTATINSTYACDSASTIEHWQNPDNRQSLDEKFESYIMRMMIAINNSDDAAYQQVVLELSEWCNTLNDSDSAYVMGRLADFMNSMNPDHAGVDTAALDAKINTFVDRITQATVDSDKAAADQVSKDIAAWIQTLTPEEQLYAIERMSTVCSEQNQMRHTIMSKKLDYSQTEIEEKLNSFYYRILLCSSEYECDVICQEMNGWISTLNYDDNMYALSYMRKLFMGNDCGQELPEERKTEIRVLVEEYWNDILYANARGDQRMVDSLNKKMEAVTATFTEAELCYYMEVAEEILQRYKR